MAISKVSKKELISIPAEVRKALDIEEGDMLVWKIDKKHGMAIVKVIKNPIKYLKGKYNDPNLTYEKVEGVADKLLIGELHADN